MPTSNLAGLLHGAGQLCPVRKIAILTGRRKDEKTAPITGWRRSVSEAQRLHAAGAALFFFALRTHMAEPSAVARKLRPAAV